MSRRGLSIRAKLTAGFAAAMLLVLVLAGGFVYLRVDDDLNSSITESLRSRANDLVSLVKSAGRNLPELSGRRLGTPENEEGFSQILNGRGRIIASTLAPGARPALTEAETRRALSEPITVHRRITGIEGEARILGQPASSAGREFVVVAGASTDDRREALAGLRRAFLIGAPLALLLASSLGYFLAGRSLAPVERMRRRAKDITAERSGERLPLPRSEDELRRLGETLNTMLDRLEAGLERERVFVADASHELRTPLAILKGELELAGRSERSQEELQNAVESASEEVDRLTQLAEALLVIARSQQGKLPIKRAPVEPKALLERVRDRFAKRARNDRREIVVDAPTSSPVSMDSLRIEQALANMVDNALRHGEGEVTLAARRTNGAVELEVSDDGPGFPPGFEAEAFERFSRGDAGRTGGGAGLGLAIVRAIAVAHGGEVTVVNRPDGRQTTLRLSLPAD